MEVQMQALPSGDHFIVECSVCGPLGPVREEEVHQMAMGHYFTHATGTPPPWERPAVPTRVKVIAVILTVLSALGVAALIIACVALISALLR